ncbi:sigma-70 family RNA polymerase sigma factor [Pandoraea terrae]|nr:sigma-70 family RNA polymerase sigma factor [Pandoraea terrae]
MTDIAGNAAHEANRLADEQHQARRELLNQNLRRVAQGDEQAFAELYRLTSCRVYGVVLRILRDRAEAEDVLQEVFTTVWRKADGFDAARGTALTWLFSLARNRAIDRIRQHRETLFEDGQEIDIADDDPSPAALAESSQERQRLERCLEALGPQQKNAVREAFFTGVSYSELAERASVPLGTMKSWIRRSLMQLKTCLEQ